MYDPIVRYTRLTSLYFLVLYVEYYWTRYPDKIQLTFVSRNVEEFHIIAAIAGLFSLAILAIVWKPLRKQCVIIKLQNLWKRDTFENVNRDSPIARFQNHDDVHLSAGSLETCGDPAVQALWLISVLDDDFFILVQSRWFSRLIVKIRKAKILLIP